MIRLKYITLFFFALTAKVLCAQSPSFTTYINPVIPGDHPDPTLTRVGKYYYTSGSSFNPTPVIYRSTDMVHWEVIAQPISSDWKDYGDSPMGGIWGGHLVFHQNKFWHFFGHWGTMYFVTANQPEGPWSAVIKMNTPALVTSGLGQDNSIFTDDDGKWYLLVKAGQENNWIVELGTNGQPAGKILDLRWLNPKPAYQYGWAEGPVMAKYKGFYYYYVSENAGGKEYIFRSKILSDIKEDWEYVGVLFKTDNNANSLFSRSTHNSEPIMAQDSTHWIMSHSYLMKNYSEEWAGQGRQGVLSQVSWNDKNIPYAQYPLQDAIPAPALPSSGIPWMVPKSDYFNSTVLNPEWSFLGFTPKANYSLSQRPGWFRLSPYGTKARMICKNDAEHAYSLITRMDFTPTLTTDEAGLRVINGNENSFVKLYSTFSNGKKVIRFTFENLAYETENLTGNVLWLKMVREIHKMTAYYSANGFDWTKLGETITVSNIDKQQPDYNSWTGNRQGLYVFGKLAYFDLYIYRDAYTSTPAECPANLFGVKSVPLTNGIGYLNEISNDDWALYAGVEFGGTDYPVKPLSFEALASSVASGVIEIWLDSIQTGTKIGECKITTTGSLSTYKTFTSEVNNVNGRHDVYLRFKGDGTAKLFQLKSFRFNGQLQTVTGILDKQIVSEQLKVYPNPAKNNFTVSYSETFSKIRILNLNGQVVDENDFGNGLNTVSYSVNLVPGNYLLEVITPNKSVFTRLIIQ